MIKLLFPLPKKLVIAFSGGVDSVAVTDFLSRKHDVCCAFFHHNTENSEKALTFVSDFCDTRDIPLYVGVLGQDKAKGTSREEHWRNYRYKFLESINLPVITAHNLDDCVETYIWSCLHGSPKVIPKRRNNILRPFLTTKKQELINWCLRKNILWCEDQSNTDIRYTRNYIRHNLVPVAQQVNPGLKSVVKRIVEQSNF